MAEERNFRKVRRGYVVSDKIRQRRLPSTRAAFRPTRFVRQGRSFHQQVQAHDEHNDAPVWRPRGIARNSASRQDQA